jgi:SPP1 gp7 family putative phage head morphogenesis protein
MKIRDLLRFKTKPEIMPVPPPDPPTENKTPPRTGEIGWFSTSIYSSGAFTQYNPDELLTSKGFKIYRRMMIDDQIKACLRFKQYSVISRGWYFDIQEDDAGNPDAQQTEIADFFDALLQHLRGSFSDKLIEILSAMESGYSIVEKIFEPFIWNEKTMWGLRDLKLRPFESFNGGFEIDVHGNINKIQQVMGSKMIELPLDKIIHFIHQPDKDRVYGESDLRAAYRNWWSKDIIIKFWNIFLERYASGFTWAQITGGLTDPQLADLQNVMKNISAQTSILLPSGVDLKQQNPATTDAFERAIAGHDKGISKSLLVPNLLGLSEQGSVGSYSQSQTQLDAFFWILEQIAVRLAEALNEQLFRDLALWNFGTEEFPQFKFEEISAEQKAKISTMWADLVSKGAVTKSDTDEAYIRRLVGFPKKAEEETEPMPPAGGIIPPEGEILPEDEIPPNNEGWIQNQPADKQEVIKREFKARPWLKRVDYARTKQELDRGDEKLAKALASIMALARISLEQQITRIVGDRTMGKVTPKEIEGVKIPSSIITQLRKVLRNGLQETLNRAYEMAKRELPAAQRRMFAAVKYRPGMDKTQAERFLSSRSMKIAGVVNQRTLEGVQRVLENGIRYDKGLRDTMMALRTDTDLLAMLPDVNAAGQAINVPARLENIVRTNDSYAWNEARQALFTDPELRGFVQAFEYSAVLDDRTTDICEELNGLVERDWAEYTPPNHFQCRSILVPITEIDDWDQKESTLPADITPQKGFM